MRVFNLALAVPVFALALHADSQLAVDRGLPKGNLNKSSGDAARSNVRWSLYRKGFVGDDFRIGQPGERWVVDRIRTWAVPGAAGTDPAALGDVYEDVRLYVGAANGNLSPLRAMRLNPGSNGSGPGVTIAPVTGEVYENFGETMRVWQIDFDDLNLVLDGAEVYRFGVWGLGRVIPGRDDQRHAWFNYASSAQYSESRQDGADGRMLLFEPSGEFGGEFDSNGGAWNKSSDINVQVFAHLETGAEAEVTAEGVRIRVRGSKTLDVTAIDPSSIKLRGQAAARYQVMDADGDGAPDLVLDFSGVRSAGCVNGHRFDGTPFSGCAAARQ